TAVRLQIQAMLEEATGADTLDWSLVVEGGNLAMLRYVFDFRGRATDPDEDALDAQLQDMLRGWSDALESALAEIEDPGRAAALAARYAEAFPAAYRVAYGPIEAARDIARLRRIAADQERPLHRDARLYRQDRDPPDELRLKIYQAGESMALSDAVPALENFGFRVIAGLPTEIGGGEHGRIHDFRLARTSGEDAAALIERAEVIEAAICAVLNGQAENDVFNRLVIGAGLTAQEADWLRALYR